MDTRKKMADCLVHIESEDADGYSSDEEEKMYDYNLQYVNTDSGDFYVAYTKDLTEPHKSKPVILTFHDVGFNYRSSFESFFAHPKMRAILKHFSLLHVNAPGQELFAKSLKEYPSLDQIARAIKQIVDHFGVNEFVGFGVSSLAN